MSDGYIKFSISRVPCDPPAEETIAAINRVRTELFDQGCIGITPDGIGFGNLSIRHGENDSFYITATRTGGIRVIEPVLYSLVMDFDLSENTLVCGGRKKASSEALSHGALYRTNQGIRCVIHIHHKQIWEMMLAGDYPATDDGAEFGTPEMAESLIRLSNSFTPPSISIVMKSHEDGVIVGGSDVESARGAVFALIETLNSNN